jgi:hypothetical protein
MGGGQFRELFGSDAHDAILWSTFQEIRHSVETRKSGPQ